MPVTIVADAKTMKWLALTSTCKALFGGIFRTGLNANINTQVFVQEYSYSKEGLIGKEIRQFFT